MRVVWAGVSVHHTGRGVLAVSGGGGMTCAVCGTRTYKTKQPMLSHCTTCGKGVCPKHLHYQVDGNNAAITNSAAGMCASCAGMLTIRCVWVSCGHVVEHRDPVQGSRVMRAHYECVHAADLAELGYGGA